MTIQQLKYVLAVDRTKNFTRAAEECLVSQATLSAMIKKLETELNTVIFDRSGSPIITTECGKEIVEEARKLIHHSENILHLPNHLRDHISGQISVGIIPTIANSLLNLTIRPLMEAFPDLTIEWVELTTENIINRLKEGRIDAGIMATSPGHDELEGNILYYELLKVYGEHSSKKKFLIPEDVSQHHFWLLEEGHCLRDQVMNLCDLKWLKAPKGFKYTPGSFDTLLDIVDNFGGLTMLPELYVHKLSPPRSAKITEFKSPFPVREVSLVYLRPYAKLRIIEALTHHIKTIVDPHLATSSIDNRELIIADIEL